MRHEEQRILPLINIVFLLLIFFMIAGQLSATDPFRIEPPASASEVSPGAKDMIVQMAANDRLAVDGEMVDHAGLSQVANSRIAAEKNLTVRIKADGGVNSNRVIEVMELLRDAGATKVHLLTSLEAR